MAKRMAGGVSKQWVREEIMAHSNERFETLDADAKLQYNLRASGLALEKVSDKHEDLLSLHSRIDLLEMSEKEEQKKDNCWRMAACAWDDGRQRMFDACFHSDRWPRAKVHQARAEANIQPEKMAYGERLSFSHHDVLQKQLFKQSAWMTKMCWGRAAFFSIALVYNDPRLTGDEACQFWAFAFAFQSPLQASLCNMQRGKFLYLQHVAGGTATCGSRHRLCI